MTETERTEWLIVYSVPAGDTRECVTWMLKDHINNYSEWDWWADTVAEDLTMAWYK